MNGELMDGSLSEPETDILLAVGRLVPSFTAQTAYLWGARDPGSRLSVVVKALTCTSKEELSHGVSFLSAFTRSASMACLVQLGWSSSSSDLQSSANISGGGLHGSSSSIGDCCDFTQRSTLL